MQQYQVNIDSAVDPNATTETLNVIGADGTLLASMDVDITASSTVFQVDDPSTLVGATAVLVDSNSGGPAPASSPVAIPPIVPPVQAPTFSRQIVSIVPVGGSAMVGRGRASRPILIRKIR